jgi:hypothetical protein
MYFIAFSGPLGHFVNIVVVNYVFKNVLIKLTAIIKVKAIMAAATSVVKYGTELKRAKMSLGKLQRPSGSGGVEKAETKKFRRNV